MKQLLEFLIKGVLGSEKFEVNESEDNGRTIFTVTTDPSNLGLLIGKGGKVVKALRNLLKVRATLEKKAVALNIGE